MEKLPYLVDVPVKINIWIRPECQKKQFEVIKQARPSILFIQSDGGRNEKEWDAIRANRKMIDDGVDWECTVYRLYEDHNNGLYAMGKKSRELIWSKVDRCIFLEDDILPSVSFFEYCAELLEKYKDDPRIEVICGMNHLEVSDNVTSDYFFSRQGSIWGVATWKRVVEERGRYDYGNDEYILSLLKERTKHNPIAWKRLNAYAKCDRYEGHVAGAEFWYEFDMYAQNRLQIIPKYNLVSNIGCTVDSEHADSLNQLPHGFRKIFNMKTYELKFPLHHPQYVIPDIQYEKKRNRVMAYNYPVIGFFRRIERILIKFFTGNGKDAIRLIKRKFRNEN